MTISYRFGLLFLSFSLVCLAACGGGEFVASPGADSDAAEDAKPDTQPADVSQEDAQADADAGKPEADAKAEDAINPPDAEAGLPEADALAEAAEDVLPDNDIKPDVKPDGPPVSVLCDQNKQGQDDVFVVAQSAIGTTVRISIFGSLSYPPDAGTNVSTSGWCWGDLGQTLLACFPQVSGQNLKGVKGLVVTIHSGISLGEGDPQTAPLCAMDNCADAYTLCQGPHQLGSFVGKNGVHAKLVGPYTSQSIEFDALSNQP